MGTYYRDYIIPFYFAPMISVSGVDSIITGHASLGFFYLDTVGIQARLIGITALAFTCIVIYFVFYQIPKSLGKGKIREILIKFVKSPFLYAWILAIVTDLYAEYMHKGVILYFFMLIICFIFQRRFNKAMIEIYEKCD